MPGRQVGKQEGLGLADYFQVSVLHLGELVFLEIVILPSIFLTGHSYESYIRVDALRPQELEMFKSWSRFR